MSTVVGGRGSPKSRRKEHNELIYDNDKGEGVKKSPKCCGRHIWKPPNGQLFNFFAARHKIVPLHIIETAGEGMCLRPGKRYVLQFRREIPNGK